MAQAWYELPKTVVEDGILRAAEPFPYVSLDEPYPVYLLHLLEDRVAKGQDLDILINADLAMKKIAEDKISHQKLTTSDLAAKSKALAVALRLHLGLEKAGGVVQVSLPNTTDFFFPVMGTWLARGTVSLVDPTLSGSALSHLMQDCRPKIVFCWQGNIETICKSLKELNFFEDTRIVLMDLHDDETGDHRQDQNVFLCQDLFTTVSGENLDLDLDFADYDEDEVGTILWTSGTTSRRKGIQRTFGSLANCAIPVLGGSGLSLLSSHFFHGSGLITFLAAVGNGRAFFFCPAGFLSSNAASKLHKAVDQLKIEKLSVSGNHVMDLCYAEPVESGLDLSSIKFISPVGTNVPGNVLDMLRKTFPNLVATPNVYTLTEFGSFITMSRTTANLGYLFPGTTVKIMDEGRNKLCGVNEVGEIYAKCPIITPGYLNRPEEDAKLFAPEGFMRTGDLGCYDEAGVLYFRGRCKELIISMGRHVFPAEVEAVIAEHPHVSEVAVFAKTDPVLLELVAAAVVRKQGSKLTASDVENMVTDRLEDHKRLRGGVFFVDKLPKNAMGKVLRRKLQAMFKE